MPAEARTWVHTVNMTSDPLSITTLMIRPVGGVQGFFRGLLARRYVVLVPEWDDTPYGKLSEGLFWEAHRTWQRHRRLMHFWAAWHYLLGSLGVALAGLAGFGGLSNIFGAKEAAYITIGSTIAMGLATFLRSDDKRRENEELAVAWDMLRDDIATLYITRPGYNTPEPDTGNRGKKNSIDPDKWEIKIQALRLQAQRLRAGKIVFEPPPTWPDRRRILWWKRSSQ
jgi:hypothetical protein